MNDYLLNRTECYCGNNTNYNRYGTTGATCTIKCAINTYQICGGVKYIYVMSTACVGLTYTQCLAVAKP